MLNVISVGGSSSFEKFPSEIVKFSDTQPRFSGFTQVPTSPPPFPARSPARWAQAFRAHHQATHLINRYRIALTKSLGITHASREHKN